VASGGGSGRAVNVTVVGQRQLTDLYRELRRQADGADRVKQLRRELSEAARPLVPLVKMSIGQLPSKNENAHRGRMPLRTRFQRAVSIQTRFVGKRTGVYVYMNPRKMPDQQKALPAYFEKADKRSRYNNLRHPVYGNRDVWVHQPVPPQGYFTWAVRSGDVRAARAVEQVLERVARQIENG